MNTLTKIKRTVTTIATADMRNALALAKQCMNNGRNTIPVLAMVRVSAGGSTGGGTIYATDLDREINVNFPAEGEAIDFLIQPRILAHVLRHGGPAVEISRSEGKNYAGSAVPVIVFKTGELTARINDIIPVEDYPQSMFEQKPFERPQEIDAESFRYGLDAAAATISTEETRYYLNGIFLESVDGHLRMISTDGHRLTQVDCPDIPWKRDGMILPRHTVMQLRKDLKGLDKIKVAQDKDGTRLRITNPKWSMVTKLIDGHFPDYRRVIPQNVDGSFSVAMTGDALAALPSFIDVRSAALHIVPEDGHMFVRHHELGEVSMPIHGARGAKRGVNINYLKSLCPRGEAVRLVGGSSGGDPILVMGADENVLRVVMPMRI